MARNEYYTWVNYHQINHPLAIVLLKDIETCHPNLWKVYTKQRPYSYSSITVLIGGYPSMLLLYIYHRLWRVIYTYGPVILPLMPLRYAGKLN